jgi:hypothetical protein
MEPRPTADVRQNVVYYPFQEGDPLSGTTSHGQPVFSRSAADTRLHLRELRTVPSGGGDSCKGTTLTARDWPATFRSPGMPAYKLGP